jgi:hypothetical protein
MSLVTQFKVKFIPHMLCMCSHFLLLLKVAKVSQKGKVLVSQSSLLNYYFPHFRAFLFMFAYLYKCRAQHAQTKLHHQCVQIYSQKTVCSNFQHLHHDHYFFKEIYHFAYL